MAAKTPESMTIGELFDLSGQVAVVTGGAMGIGYGISRRLAEAGAAVMIADYDAEAGEQAAQRLREEGRKAAAVRVDVRREDDVRRMVQSAVSAFGGIDILVNNAGIYPRVPILEAKEDDWDLVMDTNLKGAFFCSREVAKQMIEQGRGGCLVNITSGAAVRPSVPGLTHYDTSKAGLAHFTRSLARDLAPYGIRVLAVAPGATLTEGTQRTRPLGADEEGLRRLRGTPDDVARVVLFVVSPAGSYLNGQQLLAYGEPVLERAST